MTNFNGLRPTQSIDWVATYAATVMDPTTRRHIREWLEGWLQGLSDIAATVPEDIRGEYVSTWDEDKADVEAALARLTATDPKGD
jgi:hypothetical protein